MEIKQSFTVARPLAEVWALFQDVPVIAGCMPGAELTEDKGNGAYAGRVGIRLGPFNASFEGEARLAADAARHSGHLEGRGTDKRGGSRSKLILDYRLTDTGGGTRVDVDADMQLAGPIAQFGRTGIITETANVLIQQFVQNVEATLTAMPAAAAASASPATTAAASSTASPRSAPPANRISLVTLLAAVIASFFRRLLGRGGYVQR